MKSSKTCVIEVLKREEREYIAESLYEEIVSFFSPKLMKCIKLQIQELLAY